MKDRVTKSQIIKVEFFLPVDGKKEYYFGSLAAIYERFSEEQIGCKLETLWAHKLAENNPKSTRKCVITRQNILRKKHGAGSKE
ncbi:MAG TPA: hypothetical protein PLS84_07660 [Salinivirgaceae bacterium]|jgi:hypothetical protein|nr:hypothetical protein [Bacteroidales bacterium]HPW66947.1 hypothetical protein [Salinivirgaceae bacterium]